MGATSPSEGISYDGAPLPIVPALALKATLTSAPGALTNLQALRDQTMNQLYDLYKNGASPAQQAFVDGLVTSQQQVRSINQSLLNALGSIIDNTPASQILAALEEAHAKGIIHRDLKPGNIMIAKTGVKVLDFGLAKSGEDDTVTASHVVMGTPAYMAPEQREGKPADARSDIYSFGCVLYEIVTGSRASAQRKRIAPRNIERI